jgi:hypothetical protein
MTDPTQFDPDTIRVALDHGEVVELDGGTLVLDGEESPSVVLRLAPWRARSVARVLQEWSSVSRIFHQTSRPHLEELDLSRMLELAAAALGDHDEPTMWSPRGSRLIPNRQRLAAVAVLGEREPQLSAIQTPCPGRCRRMVALRAQRRRGTRVRSARCDLFGSGHDGTYLFCLDHSIRRTR